MLSFGARTQNYQSQRSPTNSLPARFEAFYNTPKVSNWLEMWQAHNEELSLAWAEEESLEVALGKIVDRINNLISEAEIDPDQLYWTAA